MAKRTKSPRYRYYRIEYPFVLFVHIKTDKTIQQVARYYNASPSLIEEATKEDYNTAERLFRHELISKKPKKK